MSLGPTPVAIVMTSTTQAVRTHTSATPLAWRYSRSPSVRAASTPNTRRVPQSIAAAHASSLNLSQDGR